MHISLMFCCGFCCGVDFIATFIICLFCVVFRSCVLFCFVFVFLFVWVCFLVFFGLCLFLALYSCILDFVGIGLFFGLVLCILFGFFLLGRLLSCFLCQLDKFQPGFFVCWGFVSCVSFCVLFLFLVLFAFLVFFSLFGESVFSIYCCFWAVSGVCVVGLLCSRILVHFSGPGVLFLQKARLYRRAYFARVCV